MKLEEMVPRNLTEITDNELGSAWNQLKGWYETARREGRAVENFVNAAVWVISEFERRGIDFDKNHDLARSAEELLLSKAKGMLRKSGLTDKLETLPPDILVVKDFVSVVGSSAKAGVEDGQDIDILIRGERTEDNWKYGVQGENIWLPVRNVFNEEDRKRLHFIDNPQGAHGPDVIPLYDLVLRRKRKIEHEIVKGAPAMPGWTEHLSDAPEGVKVDLGCGDDLPEGFIGIDRDRESSADIIYDLELGLPLANNEAAAIRANHALEHVENADQLVNEIWRALKPGGLFIATVPSVDGPGGYSPGHKSFWDKESFEHWLGEKCGFEKEHLSERKEGQGVYIDVVLRKIRPSAEFVPPRPAMGGYTEAFEVEEVLEWLGAVAN